METGMGRLKSRGKWIRGYLYHYREKEDGFEGLIVQRMIWKK
jgi:hypothetical protein